jgi:hypothetical protein
VLWGWWAFAVLAGKVDFDVQRLDSSSQPFTTDFTSLNARNPCLANNQGGTATRTSVCLPSFILFDVPLS